MDLLPEELALAGIFSVMGQRLCGEDTAFTTTDFLIKLTELRSNPPTWVTPSISIFDATPPQFSYAFGPVFQPPPNLTIEIDDKGGIEW